MKDIGKMTQEETLDFAMMTIRNLTEENQHKVLDEVLDELGIKVSEDGRMIE